MYRNKILIQISSSSLFITNPTFLANTLALDLARYWFEWSLIASCPHCWAYQNIRTHTLKYKVLRCMVIKSQNNLWTIIGLAGRMVIFRVFDNFIILTTALTLLFFAFFSLKCMFWLYKFFFFGASLSDNLV